MWRTLFIILPGLASVPAWSADRQCHPNAKAMFTFTWRPQSAAEPKTGSLRIEAHAGRTVQVLENLEYYYGDSDSADVMVDTRDFNNDGCGDLVIASSIAGIGNTSNTVFLYEPARRRFVANDALSAIMGRDIDPRDKRCVTSFGKGGAADMHTDRYCWSRGRLVLTEQYSISPRIDSDGAFTCYLHTTTTYRHGKKKTRTRCTQDL